MHGNIQNSTIPPKEGQIGGSKFTKQSGKLISESGYQMPKPATAPTIGLETIGCEGIRENRLQGDWSRYNGQIRRLKRLGILDGTFTSTNLDCLQFFPAVRALRVMSPKVIDLAGIYQLKHLEELAIHWVEPKYLRLDLARFPALTSLSLQWSQHVQNMSALHNLRSLHLEYVYGVKCLDLRSHTKLRELDIGPAKGVERVLLDGCGQLKKLTLALMPRLTEISGKEFLDTVHILDIRGSNSIPKRTISSFTALRQVMIGTTSSLSSRSFPKCKPAVIPFPV